MVTPARTVIEIRGDAGVVSARVGGRLLATDLGFLMADVVAIATAISEVARNIVNYADTGTVELIALSTAGRRGIQVVAHDDGPGIADLAMAMRDGYSSSGSLGLGLPGCRRLMDELEIDSGTGNGSGTTVVMRKWLT
jgi:serine/threonine-protein kinase RsbT